MKKSQDVDSVKTSTSNASESCFEQASASLFPPPLTFQLKSEVPSEESEVENNQEASSIYQFANENPPNDQSNTNPNDQNPSDSNNTGLPNGLKSGVEKLSGYSMNDVKVNFNSDKPAQLNAHAFAQGTDIHLGPGQERHLPHEAWHVVQQKQGRVRPTLQMKGQVNINDDQSLETEADSMGAKALQLERIENIAAVQKKSDSSIMSSDAPIQRITDDEYEPLKQLDIRIDDVIEASEIKKKKLVVFDVPDFIENEVRISPANLSSAKKDALVITSTLYLDLYNSVENSAEMLDFVAKSGPNGLGDTFKGFVADTGSIKTNLSVANENELSSQAQVNQRSQQSKTALKNLTGLGLKKLGSNLIETFDNEGPEIRNRGAGTEVSAVDTMLSMQMIEIKDVKGIYKSADDEKEGHLGAEWIMKNGHVSDQQDAEKMANKVSKDWVLHAHVRDAHANPYSFRTSRLVAAGFHLKDKETAGGADGPSVNVATNHVKADAEKTLLAYINKQKKETRKDWLNKGFMIKE